MGVEFDKKGKYDEVRPETNSQINFTRKKTKSHIRRILKLIGFSILATVIGIIISNLTINLKIASDLKQLKEGRVNPDIFIGDIDKVSPSIVSISDNKENFPGNNYIEGNTTGIIIDKNGIVVANYSKIKDMKKIYVKLHGIGEIVEAERIGENSEIDMAFLKIDTKNELKAISLAKEDRIKEGQKVALLCNSIGDEYIGGVYEAIISSNNRIKASKNGTSYKLLQISGSLNEESTGGAICNSKGELIGIASLALTKEYNQQGVYYAVDMIQLKEIMISATHFKSILGIDGGIINGEKTEGIQGFYVDRVIEDGNGYKAGLRATDIIYEIDSKKIVFIEDISNITVGKKSGDIIKCKIIRNGESKEINIIVK